MRYLIPSIFLAVVAAYALAATPTETIKWRERNYTVCTPTVGAPTKLTCPSGSDADSGALLPERLYRYDCDVDVWGDWGTAATTAAANDTKLRAGLPEYFATFENILHFSCTAVATAGDCRLTLCQ